MDVDRLEKPVRSVMERPVETVDADVAVADAARTLRKHRIGSLVVAGDGIDGILTEADVVRGVGAGIDPERTPVRELMTDAVVTVDATETVRDASARMQEYDVKRLPVTDDGDLVGIVTTTDISHSLAPTFEEVLVEFSE